MHKAESCFSVRRLALAAMVTSLVGCGSVPSRVPLPEGVDLNAIPEPVPRQEPLSKYGNPDSYEQFGKRYWVMPNAKGFSETGVASWYGPGFDGKRTSSGEIYNMYDMTAAHKALPLPTYVSVKSLKTDKTVIVRVNDRGPFKGDRIIDLSYAAAAKLGIAKDGTGTVEVTVLDPAEYGQQQATAALTLPAAGELPTSNNVSGNVPISPMPIAVAVEVEPAVVEPQDRVADGVYIQVGAYASEANAGTVRDELLALLSQDVRVVPIDSVMGILHRVRIGPYASAVEAEQQFPQLHRKGYYQARVVKK